MSEREAEIVGLLQRANELLTVLARQALSDVLKRETADPKNLGLYRLTGGELPVKAISKKVDLSVGTISRTWQRWEAAGLLVRDGSRYRRVLG